MFGTPQATVYRLFSSKLGILKALLDVSVGGDDEAVAMADRPQVRALLSDEDPRKQIAGFAALVREVWPESDPSIGSLQMRLDPMKMPLCCSPRSLDNVTRASAVSHAQSLNRTRFGVGSESTTRLTSSMPLPLPRYTAYSSSIGAGEVRGMRSG